MKSTDLVDIVKEDDSKDFFAAPIFVTIIIPVYNAEKTLQRCVESVLAQTDQRYEIILIDDGSSDRSAEMCDMYMKNYSNITVVHKKNEGVSVARNVGISVARGQYVLFLDSDDEIKGQLIEQYSLAINCEGIDVVIGSLELVDFDGKVIGKKKPRRSGIFSSEIWDEICFDSEIFGYAGGKMVSRALLMESNIRFDPERKSQEDLLFNINVYNRAKKIVLLPYTGYRYYYNEGQRKLYYQHYIDNQLEIVFIARRKTKLSVISEECIRKRIILLVYMNLFLESPKKENYIAAITELSNLSKLNEYLQEEIVVSEHGFICYLFSRKCYGCIYHYFRIRNIAKQILRGRS